MSNNWNKYLIHSYFAGIILSFIMAETEINIEHNIEQATFGAGCFWCVEAIFESLDGVIDVQAGYAGGNIKNPTYEDICTGNSGHAEVIQIEYNSNIISYEKLMDVFWKSHDPTTLNRQGADIGTQYRSVLFYHSDKQREIAEESMKKTDQSGMYVNPIMTEIIPMDTFYQAEDYHQNYYRINPRAPYCEVVIKPKLDKLNKQIN